MARTKLKRLTKVMDLPNVFSFKTKGLKNEIQNYFKQYNIFTLEIGCGHGDYSVEMAKRFPDRNFIGIDVKGARVFQGAVKALEERLVNVAFIISQAEKLSEFIQPESIEELYIFFPDPHIRRTNQSRRLISPNFLKIYKELLIDSGLLHFKTDNHNLYEYTVKSISNFGCEILFSTEHLHENDNVGFPSKIITNFEKHYIKEGRKIRYICFRF